MTKAASKTASKPLNKPKPKPKPVIVQKFDKPPEQAPAPRLEIVKVTPQESIALRQRYTDDEISLMKNTVAKGTSDLEFEFFLYVAKHRGLDPLLRQIHAVKRRSKMRDDDGNYVKRNGEFVYEETMTIQTGIDGYRVIADRTGNYAPSEKPALYEGQGTPDFSATVYVKKWAHGGWHEVPGTAYYSEYVQTYVKWTNNKPEYKPNSMWMKMPRNQLAKCAEALAFRKAFPEAMSGVYINEELEHLDSTNDTEPRRDMATLPAKPAETVKATEPDVKKKTVPKEAEPETLVATEVHEPEKSTPEPKQSEPQPQATLKPSPEENRGHGNEGTQEAQRNGSFTRPQLKAMMEALLLDLWPNLTIHRHYRAIVGRELFNAQVKADIDRLPMQQLGLGVFALKIFQSRIRHNFITMPIEEQALINELTNALTEARNQKAEQEVREP